MGRLHARAASPRTPEPLDHGSPTTASSRSSPERAAGDVQARLEQRALELWQTFDILDRLLDDPVEPPLPTPGDAAEADRRRPRRKPARRDDSASSNAADGRIARLRLRTGSYANWPVVAHAATDNLLPDFPLINKSFELCYACVDR